ncbi:MULTISPECIES: hypothetical protein [unclassified Nocardia]|uniref:hypothetical protein n=1 Tax=unclassified Nocardia TaxID=2637762 RepID=UPI00278BD59F|nr:MULTISPECIES: hypothetical protein [unclassified Nocardia]
MMRIRTTAFAAIVTAGAMGAAATPAAADPPTAHYSSVVADGSVTTTLEGATFALTADGRTVLAHDPTGHEVLRLPLAFELDGAVHPIRHRIDDAGRTLVLTPDLEPRPVASPMENQLALGEWAGNMTKGALVGTLGGFVLGALVGAALGLGSCLVVGPGCLATTPAAIMAFAAGGGLLGTLAVGGVALADGLWKYITTLQAAPGESAYADDDGLLDPNGTGVPDANLRLPPLPFKALMSGSAGR